MPKEHKVLITGSSGMLGVDLSCELSGSYEVSGVDIIDKHNSKVRSFYKGNIANEKNIAEIVLKAKPEFVVHTAAWTDVDGCELDSKKAYTVNSQGTENVAVACVKTGAILIYISTDFVFDGKKRKAYTEEDNPNPISIYGDSKLKGEEAVKRESKKYFILRTSWLYGKHGKNFVGTILNKSEREKMLRVVDDQTGSPTYTKDLAKAIRVLLDTGCLKNYGVYHVSNSGRVSWCDYAKKILEIVGSKTEVLPISSISLARPAKRPAMSELDNSKFINFTNFRMRPWEEALKEYLS